MKLLIAFGTMFALSTSASAGGITGASPFCAVHKNTKKLHCVYSNKSACEKAVKDKSHYTECVKKP